MEVATQMQAFSPVCAGYMEGFGSRMMQWGQHLTDMGKEMEQAQQ